MDVSTLIDDLNAKDVSVRSAAAEKLARLGEDARPAIVPLVRCCGDDEAVREWAVAALEEIGPPDVTDQAALADLLPDESIDVGYWAATLLGRLEERAAPSTAPLATALSSPHVAVQQRVAWALGKIGPAAATASDALRQAAKSDDARLARLAQRALQSIE